ncbi:MAG: hypothetical protein JWM80_5760 [Cyanobacteria bacterium RYN_339]|nr:hypothetical protein [Cyanobacteria bacterium RYN_339]
MRDLPLLTEAECRKALAEVHALEAHWLRRHPFAPFFTLGPASYLDAPAGSAPYEAAAAVGNPVLAEHFGWLYARLDAALAEALGGPVAPAPRFALPGFHVFGFHAAFEEPVASVHTDQQYGLLAWDPADEPDFGRPVSFTLPVALPAVGGGLDVWDLHLAQLEPLSPPERARLIAAQEPTRHAYTVGTLVLHDGHLVHRIGHTPGLVAGDERVTLQGHAVPTRAGWRYYW